MEFVVYDGVYIKDGLALLVSPTKAPEDGYQGVMIASHGEVLSHFCVAGHCCDHCETGEGQLKYSASLMRWRLAIIEYDEICPSIVVPKKGLCWHKVMLLGAFATWVLACMSEREVRRVFSLS